LSADRQTFYTTGAVMSDLARIYNCPVEAAIDAIGGKWKPIIVFHLLSGKRRFGELRKLVTGVTQRSLTMQLRELEKAGLVHREVFAEVPLRVEYSMTEFGKTLAPVMKALSAWGNEYILATGSQLVSADLELTR
jgi:DNA-binding HxlR family transcriptional regulator